MDEAQVAAFEDVQRRTIDLVAAVVGQVRSGMSGQEIIRIACNRLPDFGLDGWFRAPKACVQTRGRSLVSLARPAPVGPGSTVMLSMTPRRATCWGDFAVTFVHGEGASSS